MKLQYEREQEYRHWCKRLLQVTWWFVLLVCLAEVLIFLLKRLNGTAANTGEYVFTYILRPALVYVAVGALVHLLSRWLLRRRRYTPQALLYLTGVTAQVLMLAWTHSSVGAISAVFLFPVLMAVVFEKRWPLVYVGVLNLVCLLVFCYLLPPTYPMNAGAQPDFLTVVTAVAMLVASFLIAGMLLNRQSQLVEGIMAAHQQSKQDSLTKLYNHAAFYEQLDNYIRNYNTTGEEFCLIIIDLDNFKLINDRFGHAVGDVVITTLVATINEATSDKDEVFRYGGEEFTLLTRRNAEESVRLANAVLQQFSTTLSDASWGSPVTASAGVCAYNEERFGAKREFFAAADEALYEAKRTGKDRTVVWTEEMSRRWGAFEQETPQEEQAE